MLLACVLGVAACDWRHVVQLQVRPAPPEDTFSAAVAAVATKASLVADHQWGGYCPLGSFMEAQGTHTSQVIRICAGKSGDTAVVDLSEFNKGGPWCPDATFVDIQETLEAKLRSEFGHVEVIKGATGGLKIEPTATP